MLVHFLLDFKTFPFHKHKSGGGYDLRKCFKKKYCCKMLLRLNMMYCTPFSQQSGCLSFLIARSIAEVINQFGIAFRVIKSVWTVSNFY